MASTADSSRFNSQQQRLLLVVLLLTLMGLTAIYAASSLKGQQQFSDEFLFLRKQIGSTLVGLFAYFIIQLVPWRWIERATLPLLLFTLGLLSLIFIPGMYVKIGGASRWLNIPIIGGQPSELTKLAMVLFLARNLSRPSSDIHSFTRGVLPNIFVFAIVSGLLLLQKDLGTPVLLFAVTFCMLFAAGVTRKFVLSAVGAFLGAVCLAIIFEPYRMARVMSFLDPWSQVKGSGFQIIQSFVAFQNGGLFGVGLGESKQKLFFLPEAHTDFILAVIGEESGLLGVLLVCACFLYLCAVGFQIAQNQNSPHKRFLAFGLTVTIVIQALINIGVCMGLLPTKGMTLPFVSSGSSSLLVFLMISAILTKLAGISPAATEDKLGHAEKQA
ncbi:MAG: putative lipid II flippase FtsW [Deltaproteobacteria bacterium]|nr:putative lipid II flippase FtsW [Deltaproteobacteria bacterium]